MFKTVKATDGHVLCVFIKSVYTFYIFYQGRNTSLLLYKNLAFNKYQINQTVKIIFTEKYRN
jgi:hypothetical protein